MNVYPSKRQRFLSRQPFRYLNTKRRHEKRERRCVHDTKYSQAVSHPSTNFAQPGLTAVIGREPVLSWWCGRERLPFEKTTISIKTTVWLGEVSTSMGDCLGILRVVNAASLFFHASASCLGSETVVLIEIVVFSKGRRSRPHHQKAAVLVRSPQLSLVGRS